MNAEKKLLLARVHFIKNSQTRTFGALSPACAGCLLVIAAKTNAAFGVVCFFARVHYIISSRIRAIALFILLRRIFVR